MPCINKVFGYICFINKLTAIVKKLLLIIFIYLPIFGFSQDYNENLRLPIWTFHTHNTTIYGVSIGAFSHTGSERFVRSNGIRLEIPGIGFLAPIGNGSPITGIDTLKSTNFVFSEIINGINISTGSWGNINYNGVTIGLIAQYGNLNNGLALAGLWNSMNMSNGIQISILLNETLQSNGMQFSLSNGSLKMNGIQIGAVNSSHISNGIQIGLYNKSKETIGFQIGLWNVNEKRKLPILNCNFRK